MKMIRIKAIILLYKGERKSPFSNGYRPLFNFIETMKVSGKIMLPSGKREFLPGEKGQVDIIFLNKNFLGDTFGKGAKFSFGEGAEPLGEGEVLDYKEIKSLT